MVAVRNTPTQNIRQPEATAQKKLPGDHGDNQPVPTGRAAVSSGCPFLSAQANGDASGLKDLAKQVMSQETFGDDSFQKAEKVLEEALRIDSRDEGGEIHALLGKAQFLSQRYGDARRNFKIALEKDPDNADLKDLLKRADENIRTSIARPQMPVVFPDKDKLLQPPAMHIRAPEGIVAIKSAKKASVMGAILGAVKKPLGAVLGSVINLGIKGAGLLGTNGETWTNWSKKPGLLGTLTLGAMREKLNETTLQDPYEGKGLVGFQAPGQKKPEWTNNFRTANGSWNTNSPMEGAAGTAFSAQGVDKVKGRYSRVDDPALPSPREVSRVMLAAKRGKQTEAPFLNQLTMAWIQFMNHDWVSHGENQLDETHKIELAKDDPIRQKYGQKYMHVRKSQVDPTRPGENKYLNEVTHWWDGSQIYGSDQETQDRLRTGANGQQIEDGKIRIGEDGQLALNPETGLEETGFTRNWWVGLNLLHTTFHKNHNKICDELKAAYPEMSGDQLFHTARLINAAVMAKVHTVEWTPAVLPNKKLTQGMGANWWGLLETWFKPFGKRRANNPFDVANPILGGLVGGKRNNHGKPYALSEEFVEVYRLHAGLPENLKIRSIGSDEVEKEVSLNSTRGTGARATVEEFGTANLINSLGHQHMNALVNNNYAAFMTEMSIDGQAVVDLGAIDVLRARERGVLPYNEFRKELGLKRVKSFEDLGCDAETVKALKDLYGHDKDAIDRMDLLVGTLTEAVRPENFGFGETLFQIFIQMASRRLEADPFYTERFNAETYTEVGMDIIQRSSMKGILTEHYPELASEMDEINNAFEPFGTNAQTHPEEHPLAKAEKY